MTIEHLRIINDKKKYQNDAEMRRIQFETMQKEFICLSKAN